MFNIADLMQVFEKVPRDIKPVTYPMVYLQNHNTHLKTQISEIYCSNKKASKDIAAFDKNLFKKTFKFGIIYQKYGLVVLKYNIINLKKEINHIYIIKDK